jgi:pimeloyl-ACP methyl ester carboxylesterase
MIGMKQQKLRSGGKMNSFLGDKAKGLRRNNKILYIGIAMMILAGNIAAKDKVKNKIKDVFFTASVDGSEQAYCEILPKGFRKSKSYDVIIGLHGHGADRQQFAKDPRGECKAFRDIAKKYKMIAITPDYRARTSWMGPKAETDLLDIIKKLKAEYKVKRVFLIGGSMGGTSSLTFAALHPDLVDGVTSMNGLANHLEYKKFQPAISKSFGGSKKEIPEEYKKRSAEFWPEKFTMPVAITVGGKDKIVPPTSVLRLAEALKKLKIPLLVIDRPEVGHETKYDDAMEAMEFMVEKAKPQSAKKKK